MNADGVPALLPRRFATRIDALWDEVADFGAHDTDVALGHVLRVLSELVGAQNAFWLGAVRLGSDGEPLRGWRMRAVRRMNATPEDEQVYRFSRQRLDHGSSDEVTLAQVRDAGVFRARLLRELASPAFLATPDYDALYRARSICDALFVVTPINRDAESYFGWYRIGEESGPFSVGDRDVLAYALRPLKWFNRRVMLYHGLLIARAPLTATERRLLGLLLTERTERDIADDLDLTLATTHTYITRLFRKFSVSGRAGLTALWLGNPPM